MATVDRWLLPDGIEEVLPPEAARIEVARRQVLDLFQSWGYEFVVTPHIEYLESLLVGTGHDLDLQTFKLTDQLSGRTLGVRADMTPQVARIDAHDLQRDEPTRLCYLGTVLHALNDPLERSRSPLQVGAELYGHAGIESDLEIVQLMLETLALAGIQGVCVDFGHVGIFRGLAQQAGFDPTREAMVFEVLQRKANVELDELLDDWKVNGAVREMLATLPRLNGNESVIDRAREVLAGAGPDVLQAVDYLEDIDCWYASPMQRTRQTVEALQQQGCTMKEFVHDVRLREIDFGRWEQKTFAEIVHLDSDLIADWQEYENFR